MSKYVQPFWHFFYIKKINKIFENLKYLVSINPYGKELIKDKTNATIFDICNPITDEFFKIKNKSLETRILYIGTISKMKNLFNTREKASLDLRVLSLF